MQGQDVLVRYLSDSIRLVESALRKNAAGDLTVRKEYMYWYISCWFMTLVC